MALWTQSDIDKLKAAIIALASGEAVQSVRYDGPPARSVTYHQVQIPELRKLLTEMTSESAGGRRTRVAAFRKGFY